MIDGPPRASENPTTVWVIHGCVKPSYVQNNKVESVLLRIHFDVLLLPGKKKIVHVTKSGFFFRSIA